MQRRRGNDARKCKRVEEGETTIVRRVFRYSVLRTPNVCNFMFILFLRWQYDHYRLAAYQIVLSMYVNIYLYLFIYIDYMYLLCLFARINSSSLDLRCSFFFLSQNNFGYDSRYWSNKKSFNPQGGTTGFDESETKLPSYWSTPFSKICLGMKVAMELQSSF